MFMVLLWSFSACVATDYSDSPSTDPVDPTDGEEEPPPGVLDLEDRTSLDVQGVQGSITVRGVAGSETISILAVREGAGELSEPITSGYSVLVQGARIVVTVTEGATAKGDGIDLYIEAPAILECLVRTGQGSIQVDSMEAGGHLQVETGTVSGTGLVGDFSVVVNQGEVVLAASILTWGGFNASVETGPITLSLPSSTSAQVEASTDKGSVAFVDLDFVGANAGGQASGLLGAGEGSVDLSSGAGDITLIGLP